MKKNTRKKDTRIWEGGDKRNKGGKDTKEFTEHTPGTDRCNADTGHSKRLNPHRQFPLCRDLSEDQRI
jgi:hypothetical protein